jgi:hypothetical protein
MKALPAAWGTMAFGLLISLVSVSTVRAETSKTAPRTEVNFVDADNYTDWRLSNSADWYRDSVFTAIRAFLVKQTEPLLPDGYALKVTFTDIDLGHTGSRRVPANQGAPAFDFTYMVTDPSGRVIRQGSETLKFYTDFGNYRFSVDTTDLTTEIIQPEKAMLKSWAVTRLSDLRQR